DYAVLGEPAATTISAKTGKSILLDLQKAFADVHPEVNFVQAGLFATNSVTAHSAYLNALADKLSQNAAYVSDNISSLKDIFTEADSTLKNVSFTAELINRCNIGFKKAGDVKADVVEFLNTVKEYNPKQIGGKLPEDDFYYDYGAENSDDYKKTTFTIGVVDGAPSLAVTNIINGFVFTDGDVTIKTEVSLRGGAEDIKSGLINGDFDMAIAPLNMASSLYNAKGELGIRLLSVNIFGCLYLIG
ncbi:MAG: hypothetical protein J5903_02905, partial [Clostridia bacterium]|nr:hypothetical protein [Clostridia bacterium]